METKQILPLHTLRIERTRATLNRVFLLVHSLMLLALLYYRASWFFFFLTSHSHTWTFTLTWFLLLTSELTLSFIWLLGAAYRWRPVSRTAFPERLSDDSQLPGIDVFICTADPAKEPPLDVMNTVVSAMALDYPTEKLWVYLSDDGGADITLYAMRKAFSFAMVWLPFCRKYGVRTRSPNAYFSKEIEEDDGLIRRGEFCSEREKMKVLCRLVCFMSCFLCCDLGLRNTHKRSSIPKFRWLCVLPTLIRKYLQYKDSCPLFIISTTNPATLKTSLILISVEQIRAVQEPD